MYHCVLLSIFFFFFLSVLKTDRQTSLYHDIVTMCALLCFDHPKGRLGMCDVSPPLPPSGISRLSFDFRFTISSLVLLPTRIALSVLSFFLPTGPFSYFFSRKIINIFCLDSETCFLVWLLLAALGDNS